MTDADVIEEIKHLPCAEQSRAIQFAFELAREQKPKTAGDLMKFLFCVCLLLCLGCMARADEPDSSGYLKPGTDRVGGIRDLCLIYHGQEKRLRWDANALLPYITRVDATGKPKEWLFDSFLFIEHQNDRGISLGGDKPATRTDWQWLINAWFRRDTGLAGMEQAVAKAGKILRDARHKVNVVLAIPIPQSGFQGFGSVGSDRKSPDFSREEDRQQAIAWYVDQCLRRWSKGRFRHLNLVGFYWLSESIGPTDYGLVRRTSDYLHGHRQKLFWIPYAGAEGVIGWKERGIDAVIMQPNLFFAEKDDPKWLVWAANGARKNACGIEIEFDGRALTSEDYRRRLFGYLDAGVKYGWMEHALLGYYEGGGALGQFAASPGEGYELYEAVCRFVKERYRISEQVQLPDLQPLSELK